MITDHDVIKYFRQTQRRIPIQITDSNLAGNNINKQIYRGIRGGLWKDVNPNGCRLHMTVFEKHKVIPKYCFDCYKVLIAPRNVMELFKLLMIYEKIVLPVDNTRKCLVEVREYCSGTYKGIVYCRGVKEGNEVLRIVRAAVYEDISPQVSVTMKRGCSEYEVVYPEYSKVEHVPAMQYIEEWQKYEEAVEKEFVSKYKVDIAHSKSAREIYSPQEILAMQYWTRYAATIGDTSYIKIIGTTIQKIESLKRPPFKPPAL